MAKNKEGKPCHMPEDVVRSILTALPAKSLVRFLSLNKTLFSLIHSSEFVTTHLEKTLSRCYSNQVPNFLCSITSKQKNRLTLYGEGDQPDPYIVRDFPYDIKTLYLMIVGSCNGVLCLLDFQLPFGDLFLWNPLISRILKLPKPNVLSTEFLGFGYDPKSKDYKLIKVMKVMGLPAAEIYTLSSRTWRFHSVPPKDFACPIDSCSPAYLNGASHWLVYDINDSLSQYSILSFHMGDESFKVLDLPDDAKETITKIIVLDGLLCLILPSHVYYDERSCSVWAMEEYSKSESWVQLFNIHFHMEINDYCLDVLGLKNHGEEVLLVDGDLVLFLYKLDTRETRELINRGCYYWGCYMESLALLDVVDADDLECLPWIH